MNQPHIPLIDLNSWRTGDNESRAAVAAEVDRALTESGFLLLANHGVAAHRYNLIETLSFDGSIVGSGKSDQLIS